MIFAVLILAGIILVASAVAPKTDRPMTIAELTRSQPGIPNALPAAFLLRARGLGLLGGQLRDAGFVITSAYRGQALDDKVIDDNAAAGNGNPGTKGPGPHSECRALDVGLDAKHATPAALKTALLSTTAGQLANQVLAESNNVHLSFDAPDLEEVGALFIASNPTFDLDGAANVVADAVSPPQGEAADAGDENQSLAQEAIDGVEGAASAVGGALSGAAGSIEEALSGFEAKAADLASSIQAKASGAISLPLDGAEQQISDLENANAAEAAQEAKDAT